MLPERNAKFARYTEPVQMRAEAWRTGFGILVFMALVILIFYLIAIIGAALLNNSEAGNLAALFDEISLQSSKRSVLVNLGIIGLLLPILWLMLWIVHRRGISTLIGPIEGISLRVFTMVFAFILVLWVALELPSFVGGYFSQQLDLSVWIIWLIPATGLILLQVTAEELIFRGYLLQQFSVIFRSKWVWWLGPSLLFGLLHYNPIIYGANAWLVVLSAFIFGLILADITIRTGNLTIAIAIHFANNFYNILLFGKAGVLSNLSLFLSPNDLQNIDATRVHFLTSIGMTLVAYLIYLLVIRQRR